MMTKMTWAMQLVSQQTKYDERWSLMVGNISIIDINYADFFEPAPKAKKGKGKKKVQFAQEDDIEEQPSDAELGFDAMEDDNEEDENEEDEEDQVTKRNLFDADEEDEEADVTSTHQKRLQRVQDQIEEFENENINARHWTLQGEANAKSRPVNSLLEEDLEFDQSVKVKSRAVV